MARITYIEACGMEHAVDVEAGLSVMEGARNNAVPGILADCGGACACGTCRVYVDETWRERTGEPAEIEEATLDAQDDPGRGKRLSCQIMVTDALDGLIVRMPASQF
jgi:2Fe-2S ferredoxin